MFPNCIALLLSSLTGGNVLIVSPSGPYTEIQDAVNAAQSGDMLLVKTGTYDSFTVQAMSLTVAADTTANVTLQGGVSVLDLTQGETVCLIGLHALGDPTQYSPPAWGFHAAANLGSVRCDHCQFTAQAMGTDAAFVETSADVSFVGCQMTGGEGPSEMDGGAGARAENSSLTFFDCSVQGGDGWESDTMILPSGNGGQGLHAENCTLFSSHSSFVGGVGGFGIFFPIVAPEPGYGGAGAELVSVSEMKFISSSFVGGHDGDYGPFGGSAPNTIGGTYTPITGTYRTMAVANPVRELTSLNFSFQGEASENVYLLVGKGPGLLWDPVRLANFLLAPPFRTLRVGTTNASGILNASLPLSDLGSGVQFDVFYLQPLFVNSTGAQQLGTPITLSALDQAF